LTNIIKGGKQVNKKILWVVVSCIVMAALTASCAPEATTPPTTTPPTTTPPTTTPVVPTIEEPKYGGTLTIMKSNNPEYFDPWFGMTPPLEVQSFWLERLGMGDWSVDPDKWEFKIQYTPVQYCTGLLAESWETPDSETVVMHIRKGVRWQDKPPVNGRELTAYDVAYSFHRQLGGGDGFATPNPLVATYWSFVESVTATDKYTVVFKSKYPTTQMLSALVSGNVGDLIVAPEAVQKWGDLNDWTRAIGTGPFILEDYVSGSSLTLKKNPNYWGYDERHPKNKLPYVDVIKMLIIPDSATALAALRSAKLDEIAYSFNAFLLKKEQAESLAKTNPEIKLASRPVSGDSIMLRQDKPPFNDIRVRQALSMAIDLPTIAKTYFGGAVEGVPYGVLGPPFKGLYTPYENWPENVRKTYTYDPEGAKQLLAEAGYTNGFKTNMIIRSTFDQEYPQVIKSYFANIGVDVEIRVMDAAAEIAFCNAGKLEAMRWFFGAWIADPSLLMPFWYSGRFINAGFVSDPAYDKLVDKAASTTDLAEYNKLVTQIDDYVIAQHFNIFLLPRVAYAAWQPWLKGFSGELSLGFSGCGPLYARLWVDQQLKTAVGK
jgi:peptide/nickel transport system substrate-binding protein